MPADPLTEHDNAGLGSYEPVPVPRRGLLGALGLRRSKPVAQAAPTDGAMAAVPLAPYDVTAARPLVGPLMPAATGNVQLGVYSTPYGAPTQVHALVAGPQLRCGVETVRREFLTPGSPASPGVPFFQQTVRPVFPVMTTRDGGRPGNTVGPAGVAETWGDTRENRQNAQDTLASQLLGW
jgi:hypothetical protein